MALTAAERKAKQRLKLKQEGKYEEFKLKHKLDAAKNRNKKTAILEKLPKKVQQKLLQETRKQTRLRVAKYRELKAKKAKESDETGSPVYKSSRALAKALSVATKRGLPKSPRHKKEVVRKLFQLHVSPSASASSSPTPGRSTAIACETVQLVTDFYIRDDVTRQAPGRKDAVTVRGADGIKSKLQVRHMMYSINETYQLFKEEYPNTKIGSSKFAELRPKNVLLSCKLPHNVCLCKYHENFILAVNALHKVHNSFPQYSNTFSDTMVCFPSTTECWFGQCDNCSNSKMFKLSYSHIIEDEEATHATWHVWKTESTGGKDGQIVKVVEDGMSDELFNYIEGLVPQFLEHSFVKRKQAQTYKEQRSDAENKPSIDKALLQVDFSENYTCVAQNEIQSAHWNQAQVSLFTSSIWYSGKQHPLVIASDNTTHSKDTVVAYIDFILEELPKDIKEVSIWSDGPASQFKNRYISAVLHSLEEKHLLLITWNYFATSHGKGPVDGIGGSVKRQVWQSVKRGTLVQNAVTFVETASKVSNVKVVLMNTEDIETRNNSLKLNSLFADALPFEGISRVHCLLVDKKRPKGSWVSDLKPARSNNFIETIAVGDWVEVLYEGKLYPGELNKIENGEYLVKVMVKSGQYWKWPEKNDEYYYTKEELVRKLNPPTVSQFSSRLRFQFLIDD